MPVLRLSDRTRDTRIGHIRLGIKDPDRGGAPREIDHFLLDPHTGDADFDNRLKREFVELYGERPTRIRIMLPPFEEEHVFPVWRIRYGGKRKLCQGNGDSRALAGEAICRAGHEAIPGGGTLRVLNGEPPHHVRVSCLGQDCPFTQAKQCRVSANLKVILPELPTLGVWWIVTGSYRSIVNIQSALRNLRGMIGTYSRLPLTLLRTPEQVEYDGKTRTHYILSIDLQELSYQELQTRLGQRMKAAVLDAPRSRHDEPLDVLDGPAPAALPAPSRLPPQLAAPMPQPEPTAPAEPAPVGTLPGPAIPCRTCRKLNPFLDGKPPTKCSRCHNTLDLRAPAPAAASKSAKVQLQAKLKELGWAPEDEAWFLEQKFQTRSWDTVREADAAVVLQTTRLQRKRS